MPDAATIEAPVETKTTPPANHPGSVTIDLGNLGKKAQPEKKDEPVSDVGKIVAAENAAADAAAKEAAAKAEAAKKPNDKEENMANLRKAREAAEARAKEIEAERDRLKTEFETFKSKTPELPEDVKTKLTRAEQLEKERNEAWEIVRQTDLARDPEFQAKYNKPITENISAMGKAALAAGVTEADWNNAVSNWNEVQFGEWTENMPTHLRMEFETAWRDAKSLWKQQQSELKNADQSWQALQKKRQEEAEAQQKRYFSENEQLAKSVIAETIKPETFKEHEDLQPAVENIVLKAARHEIPAKDIFQQLAANQVLARVTVKQKSRIDELEATLAERDKKIAEQDAFIANQAGAVPRGDAAGSTAPANGKGVPMWQNIVVKAPGG